MRVAVFSTKPYDEQFLSAAGDGRLEFTFLEARLTAATAPLAAGHEVACAFVNDVVDAACVEQLAAAGVKLMALRSAGFNHVDLAAAAKHSLPVVRVPVYSPHAIAEHTVGLILALNRQIHRAHNRVREGNFSLEGLLGFDLRERTVGIIGTGRIGGTVAEILEGFGCRLVAYDPYPNEGLARHGVEFVTLDDLFTTADVITLHIPLTPDTFYIIDEAAIDRMRDGVMIVNTSRGALVDTNAAIEGLKSGKIGYLGLDVYEEESDLFFEDLSNRVIQDDAFSRLLTFPNVLITGHQAFFTEEALSAIAETTVDNIVAFLNDNDLTNEVRQA
ncbi:MAG: 2-hydroxyacid dehydrogenase [Acidimicrobiia bacterium]|nr:2-hydroxyacid dehydrogenase [Acidimicrobiia bacterium]